MSAKKSKLSFYVILFAWALFVLTACQMTNDNTDSGSNAGPTLYVAGSVIKGGSSFPCFWKNGVRIDLSVPEVANRGGSGHSICVSGNDIYIAGRIQQYSGHPDLGYVSRPCFWMNEVRTDLELPRKTEEGGEGWADSIFVVNGDVYVAGSHSDAWNRERITIPCLWKNGTRIDLGTSDEPARANSIFVSENDVFVAGETYLKKEWGSFFPCYWKNGARIELDATKDTGTTWHGSANSIFIAGNDVYIAGAIQSRSPSPGNRLIPCFWKNGIRADLSLKMPAIKEWGSTTSIFISGSNVYVAGNDNGQQNPITIPCYWKNGERMELDAGLNIQDEPYSSRATAIYVYTEDVYVAGQTNNFPCYWKNGAVTDMGAADRYEGGSANSIIFMPGK